MRQVHRGGLALLALAVLCAVLHMTLVPASTVRYGAHRLSGRARQQRANVPADAEQLAGLVHRASIERRRLKQRARQRT